MKKFIELLESQLGYAEKSNGYTKFGDWYGSSVEFDADYSNAPWCDMYLSWAAKKLGYEDWIGQFAYTVYHAEWFREQDAWGTTPKPGAIVFFDWGGSKKIDNIDHVGIVTRVEGKVIHTIEGNIDGGVAKRKEREASKIVGYGYPEKIKARLDREASEKKTIITSSTATPDNFVALQPQPDLLSSLIPSIAPLEREAETAHRPESAKKTSAPTRETVAKATSKTAPKSAASEKTSSGTPGRTAETSSAAASAPPQTAAGRTTTTGKHAKPSTADTNSFAAVPAQAAAEPATSLPELGSPTVLAPVLLAALAIIAHAKAKQSGVRLAPAGGDSTRPSRRAGSHRSGGRRRAPGRRRITRNTPLAATALTAQDAPLAATALTAQDAAAPVTASAEATLLALETASTWDAFSVPDSRQEAAAGGTAGREAAPGRGTGAGREAAHGPASDVTTVRPTAFPVEFPTTTVPVARVEEIASTERTRLPYQGRRRFTERPVAESSTFSQDAPLRGRRHRRAETSTFVQDAPRGRRHRRAETSTFVQEPAAFRQDAPTRGRRHRRPDPAVNAAVPRPTAPADGDILAPVAYSGHRAAHRTEAPTAV
ncbi:CHAP domain-containing protein [Planobispora siamensis]|nr:CHAP domain-containing protein [Planobispora siamensis]